MNPARDLTLTLPDADHLGSLLTSGNFEQRRRGCLDDRLGRHLLQFDHVREVTSLHRLPEFTESELLLRRSRPGCRRPEQVLLGPPCDGEELLEVLFEIS